MNGLERRFLTVAALMLWSSSGWAENIFDATPALLFSTSPAGQPVTLTLRQATLHYDLKVYATKSDLKQVRILAEPFRDESLRTIQPRISFDSDEAGAPKDLKLGEA